MTLFAYKITLRGTKDGDTTSLTFPLGDFDPVVWADVTNAANQIRGALVDITDANVALETISGEIASDDTIPADADTTDELVMALHLNAPADKKKLWVTRVPAPIDAVWESGGVNLDKANALVVQYVQQLSQHAYVSDGEQVNTASGTDGINRGYFRSRAKKLGN